MNQSKNKPVHGVTQLRLVQPSESDDTKYHEEPHYGGGNGGDDGMDDLRRRVERTEENIAQIKIDLAKLTTRSEEFATKSDLLSLRAEMKDGISSLGAEISSGKVELKSETSSVRSDLQKEMISIHKEIANQTKWIAATMIGTTSIALAIAKYLFG